NQRPQQLFRRNRRPPRLAIQPIEPCPQLAQRPVGHRPKPAQRMFRSYPLLQRDVAEHFFLTILVSSHTCFSRTFPQNPSEVFRTLFTRAVTSLEMCLRFSARSVLFAARRVFPQAVQPCRSGPITTRTSAP